jgi:hypothetical protein
LQQSLTYPILKYDKVPNRQHDDDWDYYGDEVYQRGPGYHYEATDLDYLIHVALPYYPDAQGASSVTRIVVKDSANHEYSGELCTDLNAILRQDLQDRMPSIAARAIARAILKYTATKAAEKAGDKEDKVLGKLFGLAVNAAGALSEAADTRSWETLPEKIFVADLSLPPGEHDLRVLFQDELGGTLKRHDLGRVTLDPGEIVIVRVRSMN